MICLLYKNFWSYDPILPVPTNLPMDVHTVYLTDNTDSALRAKQLGWSKTYVCDTFVNITDPFERRKAIAKINCFPEQVVLELNSFDHIMICDANITRLDTNYAEFVHNILQTKIDRALYITSGWYSQDQNTIVSELHRSLSQPRWSYNFDQMISWCSTNFALLEKLNINLADCPVVSAKYIGWNIRSENKNVVADWVYNQYVDHLQGNIIFSVVAKLFPDHVYHYKGFLNDGAVNEHRFNY